ncbi:MAG: DUF6962 family protein [Limnohabitans sp.]|jgi:hypothetical protein
MAVQAAQVPKRMLSLALTDGLLCLSAAWLAWKSAGTLGFRFACGLVAIPALLGFLRFSGLYPLEAWHQLFTIMSASAALPLLAISIQWPDSAVAQKRQFILIFLGSTMLLGLLISGLGKLRMYDQALGLLSMLAMLLFLIRHGEKIQIAGAVVMLVGSVLFVVKVSVPPWLAPGDWLHMGMALGLILIAPKLRATEESGALDNFA